MRGYGFVLYSLSALLVACGGGGKKPVEKPTADTSAKPAPKVETEADREQKRHAVAATIVPEGSSCLPTSFKDENAPRLELAAIGKDAVVCAIDEQRDRLLGPIACWKVDLVTGKLEYKAAEALPGRGYSVLVDGSCARGYCLPKEPTNKVVSIAKNLDGTKVAVLADDDVHVFNAETKAHESSFSIRGDKGVTGTPAEVHFVSESILVEGGEGPSSAVWVFKADGTQVGPITHLGGKEEKPVSTHHGSFSILDKTRVGVSEKGMETLTTYDVNNGARAKLVRKVPKLNCKPAELDAYWVDGDKVTDKCKDSIAKASGALMGATVVAGAKSLLVLLRGDRLGQLAVLDAKSLAEKTDKAIKMTWCDGAAAEAPKAEKAADEKAAKAAPAAPPAKKPATRGAAPKDSSDPQEGGE